MQDDTDAWTRQYDKLVTEKIARLRALSPEALSNIRTKWKVLVAEISDALAEDPAGPKAQALGARWTDLLGQLMGRTVDPRTLEGHQRSREWDQRMATFVDKSVWDFMTRVLSARR